MNPNGGGFGVTNILVMAVFFVAIYFFMIRPRAKRKKQEDEMRRSLRVGDEITTIGGIVGRIVSIKDGAESFIIETGSDRNKLKIKRWAISTCETAKTSANASSSNKKTSEIDKIDESKTKVAAN